MSGRRMRRRKATDVISSDDEDETAAKNKAAAASKAGGPVETLRDIAPSPKSEEKTKEKKRRIKLATLSKEVEGDTTPFEMKIRGPLNIPKTDAEYVSGEELESEDEEKPVIGKKTAADRQFIDDSGDVTGEYTDNLARKKRKSTKRGGYITVSKRKIMEGSEIYEYQAEILTNTETNKVVDDIWKSNFQMDYFYYSRNGRDHIAVPKDISKFIQRGFSEGKCNCRFEVYDDRVAIVATKPILTNKPLVVYIGPTVNHKWTDGQWVLYLRLIQKNYYSYGAQRRAYERAKQVENGCQDLDCGSHFDFEKEVTDLRDAITSQCACANYDVCCDSKLCPCDPNTCKNRPFDKPFAKSYVKKSPVHGQGLFAGEDIPDGGWIIEYCGEVISRLELDERSFFYTLDGSDYTAEGKYMMVDATRMGNNARFSNHSCDPNSLVFEVIDSGGVPRMLMKAIKPIKKDEEIVWNYQEHAETEAELLPCMCGTKKCTGKLNRLLTKKEIAAKRKAEQVAEKQQRKIDERESMRQIISKIKSGEEYKREVHYKTLMKSRPDLEKEGVKPITEDVSEAIRGYTTATTAQVAFTNMEYVDDVLKQKHIPKPLVMDIDVVGDDFVEITGDQALATYLSDQRKDKKPTKRKTESAPDVTPEASKTPPTMPEKKKSDKAEVNLRALAKEPKQTDPPPEAAKKKKKKKAEEDLPSPVVIDLSALETDVPPLQLPERYSSEPTPKATLESPPETEKRTPVAGTETKEEEKKKEPEKEEKKKPAQRMTLAALTKVSSPEEKKDEPGHRRMTLTTLGAVDTTKQRSRPEKGYDPLIAVTQRLAREEKEKRKKRGALPIPSKQNMDLMKELEKKTIVEKPKADEPATSTEPERQTAQVTPPQPPTDVPEDAVQVPNLKLEGDQTVENYITSALLEDALEDPRIDNKTDEELLDIFFPEESLTTAEVTNEDISKFLTDLGNKTEWTQDELDVMTMIAQNIPSEALQEEAPAQAQRPAVPPEALQQPAHLTPQYQPELAPQPTQMETAQSAVLPQQRQEEVEMTETKTKRTSLRDLAPRSGGDSRQPSRRTTERLAERMRSRSPARSRSRSSTRATPDAETRPAKRAFRLTTTKLLGPEEGAIASTSPLTEEEEPDLLDIPRPERYANVSIITAPREEAGVIISPRSQIPLPRIEPTTQLYYAQINQPTQKVAAKREDKEGGGEEEEELNKLLEEVRELSQPTPVPAFELKDVPIELTEEVRELPQPNPVPPLEFTQTPALLPAAEVAEPQPSRFQTSIAVPAATPVVKREQLVESMKATVTMKRKRRDVSREESATPVKVTVTAPQEEAPPARREVARPAVRQVKRELQMSAPSPEHLPEPARQIKQEPQMPAPDLLQLPQQPYSQPYYTPWVTPQTMSQPPAKPSEEPERPPYRPAREETRRRSPTPPPPGVETEPVGLADVSSPQESYHTTALKGHAMYPHEPPSTKVQEILKDAVLNSRKAPGETDAEYYDRLAGILGSITTSAKNEAEAYQTSAKPQLEAMKVHAEGESSEKKMELERARMEMEKQKMDREHALAERRLNADIERDIRQQDTQAMEKDYARTVEQMKMQREYMQNAFKIMEMEQSRIRMSHANKYRFSFTPGDGTRLTTTNEPCDPAARQEFDALWGTNSGYGEIIGAPYEDMVKRMRSLNVMVNPLDFNQYVNHLTKRIYGAPTSSDNSILKMRLTTLREMSIDSGVYLFQTGPRMDYEFFEWAAGADVTPSTPTVGNMYGNPRYVVHLARGKRLYAADLWTPLTTTAYFPAYMPFKSPDFGPTQGIDVYGSLYDDVRVPTDRSAPAFRAPIAVTSTTSSTGLSTPDIRSVWFKMTRVGLEDPITGKYYRLEDRVMTLRGNPRPLEVFTADVIPSLDSDDDLETFVALYAFIHYAYLSNRMAGEERITPEVIDALGAAFMALNRGEVCTIQDLRVAIQTYRAVFPDQLVTAAELAQIKEVFIVYPNNEREQESLRAAAEVEEMYALFQARGASQKAIDRAAEAYGFDSREVNWNDFDPESVADILDAFNEVDVSLDELPELNGKFRQLVVDVFRYLGLKAEYRGDNLLRRLPTYTARFTVRIKAVYPPLKRLLLLHGYGRYVVALHAQMGLAGLEVDRESAPKGLSRLADVITRPLAPSSYNVYKVASAISRDEGAVYALQSTMINEVKMRIHAVNASLLAGQPVDPIDIYTIRRLLGEIVDLDKTKRKMITDRLLVLRQSVRSPMIDDTLEDVDTHRRAVLAEVQAADEMLTDVDRRREKLALELLGRPVEKRQNPVKPPKESGRDFYSGKSMSYYQTDVQAMTPAYVPLMMRSMRRRNAPKTVVDNPEAAMGTEDEPQRPETACAVNPLINFVGESEGVNIQYRPVSETWRRNVIQNVFGLNPNSYPRTNYAIGFSPLPRKDPGQLLGEQRVRGDGNCYYRSLSTIIFGTETKHAVLRDYIARASRMAKEDISRRFTPEPGVLDKMAVPNEWADTFALVATSLILGVRLYTHTKSQAFFGWVEPPTMLYDSDDALADFQMDDAMYIDHLIQPGSQAVGGGPAKEPNHFDPTHKGIMMPGDVSVTDTGDPDRRIYRLPVPTLSANKTVYVDGELAALLLRAALKTRTLMFDKIPGERPPHKNRNINAVKIHEGSFKRADVKQKFVDYVVAAVDNPLYRDSVRGEMVEYSMRRIPTRVDWSRVQDRINKRNVEMILMESDGTNSIQDFDVQEDPAVLMVDFANRNIGGGVLGSGLVQEDLLFLTYPELLLSKVMMNNSIQPDEAVFIKNAGRVCDYAYGDDGDVQPQRMTFPGSVRGNFVAMDALDFKNQEESQYASPMIDRELHKAYVAFSHPDYETIRTGNWGGGAFRGDRKLKFLIQLMVTTYCDRNITYCCFEQSDMDILRPALSKVDGMSVSQLYDKLTDQIWLDSL